MKKNVLALFGLLLTVCTVGDAFTAAAANATTYYRNVDGTFANDSVVVSPSLKTMSVGDSAPFSATAPNGTRAGEWWVYTASPLGATAGSALPKRKVGEGTSIEYVMQADDLNGSAPAQTSALVLHLVKTYDVTANVSPVAAGTVTISGTNVVGTVDAGGKVTLTAKAKSGYAFDHWEKAGVKAGEQNSITFSSVDADIVCTAVFAELVIDKPSVTTSFTYDGKEKTCATAGDHYTVSGNAQTGAGTYTFTATLKDGYHWSDGSTDPYEVQWTIGQAENAFTEQPTIAGWTYGDSAKVPTATAKFSGTSGMSYMYYDSSKAKLGGKPSNAGVYYLKATTPSTTDYTSVTSDFVAFTIAPKEINTDNVSFEDKTETYDGTQKKIVVPYIPDNVTVSYEGNTRTEAGSQTATANFSPKNANYTVSTKSKTATLTVAQATVSSFSLVAPSVTYDGMPHQPVVSSVSTANGKTFTDAAVGWTVSYDRDDFVSAGEIKVTVTGNKNLAGAAYYPQTFTINRARTAEMSATPTALTYNGQPQGPGLTLTHCAEDAASEHEKTDVGTYYVRATPTANYAWSDGTTSSRSISWTISYLKVTVSFDLNYEGASAPSSSELNYMKGYTLPSPSRTGYDFKGWWTAKEDGTEVTTSTKVERSDAHTLYAHWKAKEYKLTITMETGHTDVRYEGEECPYSLAVPLVYDATNLNELAVVSKSGYRFLGYYLPGGAKLYDAEGHNVKDALAQYWSDVYPNGVYRHDGDLTVQAHFSDPIEMCTVMTEVSPSDAGTVTGDGAYEKGSNVVLTATANTGYSFAHWKKGEQVLADNPLNFMATADVAYTAVFTGNVYTVTFKDTGEKKAPTKTVTFGLPYGEFPQMADDPEYKFGGWFTDSDGQGRKIETSTTVTTAGDHDIHAYWMEREEFDVIYVDSLGGTTGNKTFTNQVKRVEKPEITEEIAKADTENNGRWTWTAPAGRIFNGWDPSLPQPVVHGLTLTAQWETLAGVLDYTGGDVSFAADSVGFWKVQDGDAQQGRTYLRLEKGGDNNTVTASVTKPGRLSFYWMASLDNVLSVKVGVDESRLTGKSGMNWEEAYVDITGATPESPVQVTFSCPNKEVDAFCALDCFALSEIVPEYTVTVASGEHGSASSSPTGPFHAGDSVTLTATPHDGYAFCCWTNDMGFATNENPWTFTVTDDASYRATFTNAQYVVTLDPNGGTGGQAEVIVTYDKPMPTLTSLPWRSDGWTFNGYTNAAGVVYYGVRGTSAQVWDRTAAETLVARWAAPNTYTLSVSVEGRGDVSKSPDASPYIANTKVDLTAEPDVGAAFAGWSDGGKSPTRTVTMTGDITLTATFTNCQYVVTFDANGGSVTPETKVVTYGEPYGGLPKATQVGFTCVGWFTAARGGDKVESTAKVVGTADHTLYAHWAKAVGELSQALGCDKLDFNQEGEWLVGDDPALKATDGKYVYTSTKNAKLFTTIEKSGTLTFTYKGRIDDSLVVMVKLDGEELEEARINLKDQKDYPDDWTPVNLSVEVTGDPVVLSFECTKFVGEFGLCALDSVVWKPENPGEGLYRILFAVPEGQDVPPEMECEVGKVYKLPALPPGYVWRREDTERLYDGGVLVFDLCDDAVIKMEAVKLSE